MPHLDRRQKLLIVHAASQPQTRGLDAPAPWDVPHNERRSSPLNFLNVPHREGGSVSPTLFEEDINTDWPDSPVPWEVPLEDERLDLPQVLPHSEETSFIAFDDRFATGSRREYPSDVASKVADVIDLTPPTSMGPHPSEWMQPLRASPDDGGEFSARTSPSEGTSLFLRWKIHHAGFRIRLGFFEYRGTRRSVNTEEHSEGQ